MSKKFTSFEIAPCKEVIIDGDIENKDVEVVSDLRDVEFWALYGRDPETDLAVWITDREAFTEASRLYTQLTGNELPEEPAHYTKLAA